MSKIKRLATGILESILPPDSKVYALGDCNIIVSMEEGLWHLSISHPERYPTWDEIKSARYQLLPGDITVAMLLPPKSEYVNMHENCFHLYELKKETA